MAHTRGPWEHIEPDNWHGLAGLVRSAGGEDQIARVEIAGWKPNAIGGANGQRIVACVNACEGLNPEAVPLMIEVCEVFALWTDGKAPYCELEAAGEKAKAAIAKAKGES